MEKRKLGATGPEISVVGLGCNNFGMRIDADAAKVVVDKAIDSEIAPVGGVSGADQQPAGSARQWAGGIGSTHELPIEVEAEQVGRAGDHPTGDPAGFSNLDSIKPRSCTATAGRVVAAQDRSQRLGTVSAR